MSWTITFHCLYSAIFVFNNKCITLLFLKKDYFFLFITDLILDLANFRWEILKILNNIKRGDEIVLTCLESPGSSCHTQTSTSQSPCSSPPPSSWRHQCPEDKKEFHSAINNSPTDHTLTRLRVCFLSWVIVSLKFMQSDSNLLGRPDSRNFVWK